MAEWERRFIYPRPEQERLYRERTPLPDLRCEGCGEHDVARYPVANHQGARIITRCQSCLRIVSLERPSAEDMWPPFRPVAYDWEPSRAERGSEP
jgi:hypothetical protein